jgi:hypothetical protein
MHEDRHWSRLMFNVETDKLQQYYGHNTGDLQAMKKAV